MMTKTKIITKIVINTIIFIASIVLYKLNLTTFINNKSFILVLLLAAFALLTLFFVSKNNNKINTVIDFISYIATVVATLFIITTFFLMPAQVNGESMEPTYYHGNRVFIARFNVKLNNDDIIVYNQDDKYVIKRLVASKDDKIKLEEYSINLYRILINGEVYYNEYGEYYLLDRGNQLYHDIGLDEYTLKENEIIYLGDNATNSSDSRRFGISSKENVLGKVIGGIFG